MAVSQLESQEVSDLCIGKPSLTLLPASASVADALRLLRRLPHLCVCLRKSPSSGSFSRISLSDLVCFLCSEKSLLHPADALKQPVASLLSVTDDDGLVRTVHPTSSILEALDVILEGAQTLLVPIQTASRKRGVFESPTHCALTPEDFLRFFLNSIACFPAISASPVATLGVISNAVLTVDFHAPALSAVPLLREAARGNSAVAVVDDDGTLVGEISPAAVDERTVAAIVTLSAGELLAFLDCGCPPEEVLEEVRKRMVGKGFEMMVEDGDEVSSGVSSSSDEESPAKIKRIGMRRQEEVIVCHPGSSLVAVMVQALAHRKSYIWVVDEDYVLAGVISFSIMLQVFRDQLIN